MPFDIDNINCITKVLLYACTQAHEPFTTYSKVSPEFFDAIEVHATTAIWSNLHIETIPEMFPRNLGGSDGDDDENDDDAVTHQNRIRNYQKKVFPTSSYLRRFINTTIYFSIKYIKPQFFTDKNNLTFMDLSGFVSLDMKHFGKESMSFLMSCVNLKKVKFPPPTIHRKEPLTEIPPIFMSVLENLESFDLRPLILPFDHKNNCPGTESELTTISPSFFNTSSGGQNEDGIFAHNIFADRNMVGKIRSIGYAFCSEMRNVVSLDFSGLISLTTIPSDFCSGCPHLRYVDVGGMTKVTKIGPLFLGVCQQLREIKGLEKLISVTKIGHSFLRDCKNVGPSTLDLTKILEMAADISPPFLRGCIKIETVLVPKERYEKVRKQVLPDMVTGKIVAVKGV